MGRVAGYLLLILVVAFGGLGLCGRDATEASAASASKAPTPQAPPAELPVALAHWFEETTESFQYDDAVRYAFEILNPGTETLVAEYRAGIRIRDDAALLRDWEHSVDQSVVYGPWDFVPLVGAGSRTAVTGELPVPGASARVRDVTVIFRQSDRRTDLEGLVQSGPAWLFKDGSKFVATGTLTSEAKRLLTDVSVVALIRDEAGRLVSVASTFVWFLPPGEASGVYLPLEVNEQPAAVEFFGGAFPASGSSSLMERFGASEEGLRVVDSGFVQRGRKVTYAFILENVGQEDMDTEYVVTAYDDAGRVVGVDDLNTIDMLPPTPEFGVVSELELVNDEVSAARIVVAVSRSGRFGWPWIDLEPSGARYTEEAPGSGTVEGEIVNPDRDYAVVAPEVAAITFDAHGKIVGGGIVVAGSIPPQGKVRVRVPVITAAPVVKARLFPHFMTSTELGPPLDDGASNARRFSPGPGAPLVLR